MRETLAERLLAEVMGWSAEDVAQERPLLQDLAAFKYDEYQQFSTGMHFVERLAVWLSQFGDVQEKQAAYRFIKERLLFVSEAEMRHLVSLAYPDLIKPALLRKVARTSQTPDYLVGRLAVSEQFKKVKRRSLFLGLSDGARVDVLRRMASLSNEQVYAMYQLSEEKASDMLGELSKSEGSGTPQFETLFLLDDFSGSGDSLCRDEGSGLKGKIAQCLKTLLDANTKTGLLNLKSLEVQVVLYLATQRAYAAVRERIQARWPTSWPPCQLSVVYTLPDQIMVTETADPAFDGLLKKYYDPRIMDKHLKKGGADVIHGYAGCALPLVLNHNTPNNSVHLLWTNDDALPTKGLFPRVSRHREEA